MSSDVSVIRVDNGFKTDIIPRYSSSAGHQPRPGLAVPAQGCPDLQGKEYAAEVVGFTMNDQMDRLEMRLWQRCLGLLNAEEKEI